MIIESNIRAPVLLNNLNLLNSLGKSNKALGQPCILSLFLNLFNKFKKHEPVGNVTGNRCESERDPGVTSSIPARSHTFVEIDHEIISMVILLPSAESFKKGCLLSVTSESMCTKYWLTACSSLPRKKCN